jgi:site-specific recombinase XerC
VTGAAPGQLIQAARGAVTWLVDEEKAQVNPARKVKLPRQEAGARSLTDEEFVEVYGVAVSPPRPGPSAPRR